MGVCFDEDDGSRPGAPQRLVIELRIPPNRDARLVLDGQAMPMRRGACAIVVLLPHGGPPVDATRARAAGGSRREV